MTKEILSLSVLFNMGVQEVAYVYKKVAQKNINILCKQHFIGPEIGGFTGLSKVWKIDY